MKFKELLIGKVKEPTMASNSLEKLREMTRYLVELEEEKQEALYDLELERLQLRSLFDSINEPIHVSHPTTHGILYANKAAQEIYGSDIVGKKCYEVLHNSDSVCPFCPDKHILGKNIGQTHIQEYYNKRYEHWYRCIDRAIYWPDGNGGQLARFQLAVDITEQKQIEEELKNCSEHLEDMLEQRLKYQNAQEKILHQKKLEILENLSNNIGRNLLNPLREIKNISCFLNTAMEEPDPEIKKRLEILAEEVARSERIVSKFRYFDYANHSTRCKMDVNDILLKSLSHINIPENIELVYQLDETLPDALVDPKQIEQVFGNIILNSIESMPNGGGMIFSSAKKNSEWIVISFADTGIGISEENQERLFEPFFTTKAEGIGLGLTIAKILLDIHHGTIDVQSKWGSGSTFAVMLTISGVD